MTARQPGHRRSLDRQVKPRVITAAWLPLQLGDDAHPGASPRDFFDILLGGGLDQPWRFYEEVWSNQIRCPPDQIANLYSSACFAR